MSLIHKVRYKIGGGSIAPFCIQNVLKRGLYYNPLFHYKSIGKGAKVQSIYIDRHRWQLKYFIVTLVLLYFIDDFKVGVALKTREMWG